MEDASARPRATRASLRVAGSLEGLGRALANRFVDALAFWLKDEWVSTGHAVLTGGAATAAFLDALTVSPRLREIDWPRIHVWWSDERFLPEGHIGRLDTKAYRAGLGRIGLAPNRIHAVLGPDEVPRESVEAAADGYARFLRLLAPHGRIAPVFDVVMLDVGPGGEVGALFPGHDALEATDPVVALTDAPAEPHERVGLTLPAINSAARVWLLASGYEAGLTAARVLSGTAPETLPAAAVRGGLETVWWLDGEAARAVPDELRDSLPPPPRH